MTTRRVGWNSGLVWLGAFGLLVGCSADTQTTETEKAEAPTYAVGSEAFTEEGKTLGTVKVDDACDEAAREDLLRGMALLHNMTYSKAAATFQAAAEADPECALAHWGMAMTYVHPLWPDVVPEDKLVAGLEHLEMAPVAAGQRLEIAHL